MVRTCTQCLMPQSYPGISFDEHGVCNQCRAYKPKELLGEAAFIEKIKSKKMGSYDCVLGISGGRDSCYVAYLARKRFKLKPLAVCYDFCFLRDLARQNVRNVCNRLKIDLIIVKSKNNLEFDLLRHHLMSLAATGTTWGQCLFCHYGIDAVLYKVAQERKIPFVLSGVIEHELWNPGGRMKFLFNRLKKLPLPELIRFICRQAKAYGQLVGQRREFPLPGNNCFNAYKKQQMPLEGPESIRVFDYIKWDQKIIERTLVDKAGWVRPDSQLSWRYDCILEPLLDYTYKKEFGISTVGLYLSGLIRSGLVAKKQARIILQESEDEVTLRSKLEYAFDFLEIPASLRQKFLNAK